MGKIKPAVHAVAHHVDGNRHQIHISRAFPIAEKGSLHPVRPGQDAELRVTDAASTVIVGMNAQDDIVPIFHMFVHVLHLTGKHMGHGNLYRGGQIDYGLVVRIRLPYVQNRVADLQGILRLGLGEALRAILKSKVSFRLLRHLLQKIRAVHRKLLDGRLVFLKDLFPLLHGGGIIKMHHRMGSPLHRLEGLADDMFPGLGEHLDGNILGNHVPLDESTDKIVLRIGGSRKSHLDLLEADLHQ